MASNRKEQSQPKDEQDTFQKLDEAFAESSIEDQLIVFWNRHKSQVLLGLAVAVVLILGIQISKIWSEKATADRANAYTEATDDSKKAAFAEKFSSTELGGVAFMELADKSYSNSDYAAAIPNYERAFKAFERVELKQRAHLGLALSRLLSGNESTAIADLEAISNNAEYPDAARAEALYHLSILDWQGGAFEAMLKRHDQIENLSNSGNWRGKAIQLQGSVPELNKLVEAKASEELVVEN
jgi:predicted negative regulator of RcsB-dependent stress response